MILLTVNWISLGFELFSVKNKQFEVPIHQAVMKISISYSPCCSTEMYSFKSVSMNQHHQLIDSVIYQAKIPFQIEYLWLLDYWFDKTSNVKTSLWALKSIFWQFTVYFSTIVKYWFTLQRCSIYGNPGDLGDGRWHLLHVILCLFLSPQLYCFYCVSLTKA